MFAVNSQKYIENFKEIAKTGSESHQISNKYLKTSNEDHVYEPEGVDGKNEASR